MRVDQHPINRQQSPAHIWFLTTFLKPRVPDDQFQEVDWGRALGESPSEAINRFRKLVLLVDGPMNVRMDAQYTAVQLKELCRHHNLPVSGNKDELIARLVQYNDPAVFAAVSVEMYQCSDHGRKIAERYLEDPDSVIKKVDDMPEDQEPASDQLSRAELMRLLRWLLLEGIVLGVAGNAAYDLLKTIATEAGKNISDILPDFSPIDIGRFSYLKSNLKIEWCHVPAGYFLMGSTDRNPDARADEKPQHRVYLPAFFIAKYPITNAQYAVFVRATSHSPPWNWTDGRFARDRSNHPVRGVYWHDAVDFCEWASRISRRPIRLPTEAEWEKAARGTDGRIYPWGNYWDSSKCNSNGNSTITPVDRFPSGHSPFGAYDMLGNVWEWTSSIYKDYPYDANDGREEMQGHEYDRRVIRGGSHWVDSPGCALRFGNHPDYFWYYGFRVVVSPF